jgi:hypothetical protein
MAIALILTVIILLVGIVGGALALLMIYNQDQGSKHSDILDQEINSCKLSDHIPNTASEVDAETTPVPLSQLTTKKTIKKA